MVSSSEFVPSPFARSPSINFLDEPVPVRQNLLDKFSESKKYSQSMDDLSFWSSPARRGSIQNSPLVRENRIPENPQEKNYLPVSENDSQLQENRLSMPEERVSSPDSSYRSSLSSRSPSRTSPVSFYFFLIIKNCLINDPIENLISAYSILNNKKRNHFWIVFSGEAEFFRQNDKSAVNWGPVGKIQNEASSTTASISCCFFRIFCISF